MCSNVLPFVPALLINAHHTACNCTTGLIFQVILILNVYIYVNTIKLFSFVLFLGFYRVGIALQGMDDYEEAMVAFSQGLATNPKENAMLTALVETMLKSSLKGIVVIMITVENCPDINWFSYYAIIDFHIRKFVWSNLVRSVKCQVKYQNWHVEFNRVENCADMFSYCNFIDFPIDNVYEYCVFLEEMTMMHDGHSE